MGWGDELIAAGQASARRARDPMNRRVRILDRQRQPRWNAIWEGNPDIVKPLERGDFVHVLNGPGARPYIDSKTSERWGWKPFQCTPGQIVFKEQELAYAASCERPQVVIEPTLKHKASPNKRWPRAHWESFIRLCQAEDIELCQLGSSQGAVLPGVRWIPTGDFRLAAAVLACAEAFVGHEGGLHHAAAAVRVPAVVLFGGFISPAQTGYEGHRNLFTGGEPCGMRVPCDHCKQAMAKITPRLVLDELQQLLQERMAA